jgi:hypothetical protein
MLLPGEYNCLVVTAAYSRPDGPPVILDVQESSVTAK